MFPSLTYVDLMGFEPITFSMQKRRSTNWSYRPKGKDITFSTPRGIRTLATSLRRRQRLCPLSYGSMRESKFKHIAALLPGIEPGPDGVEIRRTIRYAIGAMRDLNPLPGLIGIPGLSCPPRYLGPNTITNLNALLNFQVAICTSYHTMCSDVAWRVRVSIPPCPKTPVLQTGCNAGCYAP